MLLDLIDIESQLQLNGNDSLRSEEKALSETRSGADRGLYPRPAVHLSKVSKGLELSPTALQAGEGIPRNAF